MSRTPLAAIILAAGKGTRMKSQLHKVLHPVGGKPMISYLLDTVEHLSPEKTILVVGAGKEQLQQAIPGVEFIEQTEQLGTGHAAKVAVDALDDFTGDYIILFGDVPFTPRSVMEEMIAASEDANTGIVVLGLRPEDSNHWYGRFIQGPDGSLERIVEYKDATPEERAIRLSNSGIMLLKGSHAKSWLDQLGCDNAAEEYYLTDLIELARADGFSVPIVEADEADLLGINSRADLAAAEAARQKIWRAEALDAGVTMIDPATVYFSHDTQLGQDITLEPNVFFGPSVTLDDYVTIKANSHIEGAHVRAGAVVGPFARLRPGADIGKGAKVGNFVEMKNTNFGAGAKASHLSYIGDAVVGAGANIGAGTITCNYDGFLKYKTTIGAGAFIGSNSALVAPVSIGEGAIVGAGSVITKNVDDNALAVARGKQRDVAGFAAKFRDEKAALKAKNKSKK